MDIYERRHQHKRMEPKRIEDRKKENRKKDKVSIITVGCINIQEPGQNKVKWVDIQEEIKRLKVDACLLTATGLRDNVNPPDLDGYSWTGKTRCEEDVQKGGVGIWCHNFGSLTEQGQLASCQKRQEKDHLWLKCEWGKKTIYVGTVYLRPEGNTAWNTEIYECLQKDILDIRQEQADFIIMGDFNAHLLETEGVLNNNGKLLVEFMSRNGLIMLNSRDNPIKKTFIANKYATTLDYALCNEELAKIVVDFKVDEDGQLGFVSDHRYIEVKIGMRENLRRKKVRQKQNRSGNVKLDFSDPVKLRRFTEIINEKITEDSSYKDLTQTMQETAYNILKATEESKGFRVSRCYIWSEETQNLIQARKEKCRAHRQMQRRWKQGKVTEEEVKTAWAVYQEAKEIASISKNRELRSLDRKLAEEIAKGGREAGKRFWHHIRPQPRERQDQILENERGGGNKHRRRTY
jgi:hypothetical protein